LYTGCCPQEIIQMLFVTILGAPKSSEQLSSTLLSLKYQVKMFKKSIFFFVEDMDLFVTLNVATFENILCIPIVCKYVFNFCCIHGNKKKNQSHVAIRYLRQNRHKITTWK
jgi:hypothetical protein